MPCSGWKYAGRRIVVNRMRKQELIEDVVLTHGFWHDRRVSAQSEMRDSIRSALDNPENSAGFGI